MNRRDLLRNSATLGLAAAMPFSAARHSAAGADPAPLTRPARGAIPVAFLISKGAVVIDFCGPWEVFENADSPGSSESAFCLYTVAQTSHPIRASGGMKIVPDYTLTTAPAPKIIVIPAQSDPSPAVIEWIRHSTKTTDVTMSVCTGAFVLAKTGLLSGKTATTHHGAYSQLAMAYPDIIVKRGARFVEDGNLATAGGLTSGIDLSLRVVERYFGRDLARKTADQMEYQGQGWLNADSNEEYAKRRVSTDEHPVCAVCEMDVDARNAPKSVYKNKNFYFCTPQHKKLFDAIPERFWQI
jgi:putative intracellular protease/amidase/YHS domain-containing protein